MSDLRASRKSKTHLKRHFEKSPSTVGLPGAKDDTEEIYRGGYPRNGYRIDRYGLVSSTGTLIPLLLFKPDAPGPHPAVIVAHPEGKSWQAGKGEFIESLVQRGHVVAAIDAINSGELEMPIGRQNDHNLLFYTALMSGTSVVGLQATDLVRTFNWFSTQEIVDPKRIGLLAYGHLGPAALNAAAFEPKICSVVLTDAPTDYASMVLNHDTASARTAWWPEHWTAYDLPDLLAFMAPRKVALITPVDQDQQNNGHRGDRITHCVFYSTVLIP